MPFNRQAGGHAFDFSTEKCVKCGMTREHFQDNGKPPCRGSPASGESKDAGIILDD